MLSLLGDTAQDGLCVVDAHESNGCSVGLALVLGGGEPTVSRRVFCRGVKGGCCLGLECICPVYKLLLGSSVPWASLLAPLSWLFLSPESVRGSVRLSPRLSAPCQPASVCFLSSRSVSCFFPLQDFLSPGVYSSGARRRIAKKARLDFVPDVSVQSENRAARTADLWKWEN